jgi:hypothetical protein
VLHHIIPEKEEGEVCPNGRSTYMWESEERGQAFLITTLERTNLFP